MFLILVIRPSILRGIAGVFCEVQQRLVTQRNVFKKLDRCVTDYTNRITRVPQPQPEHVGRLSSDCVQYASRRPTLIDYFQWDVLDFVIEGVYDDAYGGRGGHTKATRWCMITKWFQIRLISIILSQINASSIYNPPHNHPRLLRLPLSFLTLQYYTQICTHMTGIIIVYSERNNGFSRMFELWYNPGGTQYWISTCIVWN